MTYFSSFSKLIGLSAGVVALQACSAIGFEPRQSWSFEQNHPISVVQKTEFMFVEIPSGRDTVSDIDKARLDVFAEKFFAKGHGPITVVAHSGVGKSGNSQALTSSIRMHLHEQGVSWSQMSDPSRSIPTTLRMREQEGRIVVSFNLYAATAAPCNVRMAGVIANYKNMGSKNLGCASQHNLAAMVADPADLMRPAALTPPDAQRRDVIVDKYRAGEVSAQDSGDTLDVQTTTKQR